MLRYIVLFSNMVEQVRYGSHKVAARGLAGERVEALELHGTSWENHTASRHTVLPSHYRHTP